MSRSAASIALAASLLVCGASHASSITFSATNGTQSASATFTVNQSDGTMTIELANQMTTNSGPNWLTGLYFDLAGSPMLAGASAHGDLVQFKGANQIAYNAHSAGQFWAMRQDLSGVLPFGGMQYGLSAVGAGVFSIADMIESGGPHPQPAGVDGGIVADFDGVTVPNGQQIQQLPFVLGTATFSFFLPADFDFGSFSVNNIAFHFGSGYDEILLFSGNDESIEVIPLPAPVLMAMIGLAAIPVVRRRFVR